MKPSPKFNHRPKHERAVQQLNQTPSPVFFTTGAIDSDFEDFGEKAEYVFAPNLVLHHTFDAEGLPTVVAKPMQARPE